MACINCSKEGQTTIPQTVVGFKIWYADGSKEVVTIVGRSKEEILNDLEKLPTTGVQIIMLYYNRFSTNGETRYRRVIQGSDIYFFAWDSNVPIDQQDWVFGQTDKVADLLNYISPVQLTGVTINDAFFKTLNDKAMADYNITEFGLTPEIGTDDI